MDFTSKNSVCGAVVIYNPPDDFIENIYTYLHQVNQLIVIDNSDTILDKVLLEQLKASNKIEYIFNNKNLGIATALNICARRAEQLNLQFLLTMDQDSKVSENFVTEMINVFSLDSRIAMLTPFIVHNKNPHSPISIDPKDELIAITSGSMVRLSAFDFVGGFLEKLFIDYVDHEFSLRLKLAGYKIIRLNNIFLYHNLGEIEKRKLLFKDVFTTNHIPIRLYYRTRNRFYVYKKYSKSFPIYVKEDKVSFIKEIIKILLFEKQKFKKLQMIWYGYKDFQSHKYDQFNRN